MLFDFAENRAQGNAIRSQFSEAGKISEKMLELAIRDKVLP